MVPSRSFRIPSFNYGLFMLWSVQVFVLASMPCWRTSVKNLTRMFWKSSRREFRLPIRPTSPSISNRLKLAQFELRFLKTITTRVLLFMAATFIGVKSFGVNFRRMDMRNSISRMRPSDIVADTSWHWLTFLRQASLLQEIS